MHVIWAAVRRLFGGISWIVTSAFAPVLLLVGYFTGKTWVHDLLQPVSLPAPPAIWGVTLALVVLALIGMMMEIVFLVDANTLKSKLQFNHLVTAFIALVVTSTAGYLVAKNMFGWWFLPGLVYSIADLVASGWLAINNAFQKNPTQIQKGEDR